MSQLSVPPFSPLAPPLSSSLAKKVSPYLFGGLGGGRAHFPWRLGVGRDGLPFLLELLHLDVLEAFQRGAHRLADVCVEGKNKGAALVADILVGVGEECAQGLK